MQDRSRAAWALAQLGCLTAAPLMEAILSQLNANDLKVRGDPMAVAALHQLPTFGADWCSAVPSSKLQDVLVHNKKRTA